MDIKTKLDGYSHLKPSIQSKIPQKNSSKG